MPGMFIFISILSDVPIVEEDCNVFAIQNVPQLKKKTTNAPQLKFSMLNIIKKNIDACPLINLIFLLYFILVCNPLYMVYSNY